MNAAALDSLLGNFYWFQLRSLARELGLSQKGKRQTIISRIMQMHADPCCSLQVSRAAAEADAKAAKHGKKRRRRAKESKAVRNLRGQFEAVAVSEAVQLDDVAVSEAAAQLDAAYLSDETLDVADYFSDGGLMSPERPVVHPRAAPAVAQVRLLTSSPIDSPDLIRVPTHLRGWRPSPLC